jgi:hypothetical protein
LRRSGAERVAEGKGRKIEVEVGKQVSDSSSVEEIERLKNQTL